MAGWEVSRTRLPKSNVKFIVTPFSDEDRLHPALAGCKYTFTTCKSGYFKSRENLWDL